MRLALAAIAVVSTVACGASSREGARRDPVRPDNAAVGTPVRGEPDPPRGDDVPPGIEAFLHELDAAIRTGDLTAALTFFDPENRAQQREIGVGDSQYVAEAIGLHQVQRLAGQDVPEPDPWDADTELSAVTRIVVERMVRDESDPGCLHAIGRVELNDGRAYAFDLPIHRGGPRGHRIIPAVG